MAVHRLGVQHSEVENIIFCAGNDDGARLFCRESAAIDYFTGFGHVGLLCNRRGL